MQLFNRVRAMRVAILAMGDTIQDVVTTVDGYQILATSKEGKQYTVHIAV